MKGSIHPMPVRSMFATFLVTTVRSCTAAVAAMSPSTDWYGVGHGHGGPPLSDGRRDRQDPVAEVFDDPVEPPADGRRGRGTPPPDQIDAPTKLTDDQHREPQLRIGLSFQPSPDPGTASAALTRPAR